MASEKDLELLDQYVSNRLNAQDRTAFEEKLAADSSLKQEFQIQRRVVDKIREARIREIKTMFNSVPVSAIETGTTSVGTQVAIWIGVAAIVGGGIYVYLTSNTKTSQNIAQQEQVTSQAPPVTTPEDDATVKEESPATTQGEKPSAESVTPPADDEQENPEAPESSNTVESGEETKGPAPLDVFDPTEETKESSDAKNPSGVSESTPLHKSSIAVELESNNKKFSFHYQFKDGKLFLYGAFEKNLYEIMEFFSDNKRTVFLFYKDNYYLLNEDNDAVKPLAPISDPTLLKKLKDYRGTR